MQPSENVNQDDQQQEADAQADGYYGEDNVDDDELDLSFLDEEDKEEGGAPKRRDDNETAVR